MDRITKLQEQIAYYNFLIESNPHGDRYRRDISPRYKMQIASLQKEIDGIESKPS